MRTYWISWWIINDIKTPEVISEHQTEKAATKKLGRLKAASPRSRQLRVVEVRGYDYET